MSNTHPFLAVYTPSVDRQSQVFIPRDTEPTGLRLGLVGKGAQDDLLLVGGDLRYDDGIPKND